MKAFIYQAALLCESCGQKMRRRRLREIKIPLKDFLYRVDPSDAAGWDDPDPKRRRWIRPLVREHWNIPVGAKTMLPPDFDQYDEHTFDSDFFPKGPYDSDNQETDSPMHCAGCKRFLENPLTSDGYRYVRECVWDRYFNQSRPQAVAHIWEKFYGIPNPRELLFVDCEGLVESEITPEQWKNYKQLFIETGQVTPATGPMRKPDWVPKNKG